MLDAAAAALLHVTLLQLQKPLSLTLQLLKRLPPNLLPKRMTLHCASADTVTDAGAASPAAARFTAAAAEADVTDAAAAEALAAELAAVAHGA